MTRDEAVRAWGVDENGLLVSPPFRGCPAWAPRMASKGVGLRDVTSWDVRLFPELRGTKYVSVLRKPCGDYEVVAIIGRNKE